MLDDLENRSIHLENDAIGRIFIIPTASGCRRQRRGDGPLEGASGEWDDALRSGWGGETMRAVVEWTNITVITTSPMGYLMAKKGRSRRSRSGVKDPLQTSLRFELAPGAVPQSTNYIDSFRELSRINRKLLRQGQTLAVQSIEFAYVANPNNVSVVQVKASTAGNTWTVHNSWTKGFALWKQMQNLVLHDNPSVAGKWRDFKIQLEKGQTSGNTLNSIDGASVPFTVGDWEYSMFVMPQHDVNPATGLPLDALQYTATLMGDDSNVAVGVIDGKRSLVKAYADSRATVQDIDPNVPAGMSTSFFNLLTDSGSQEPELADIIEDENDKPPYDVDDYVGGATSPGDVPFVQSFGVASVGHPKGILPGFLAECGLIKIQIEAWNATGEPVADLSSVFADFKIKVNYAVGANKGLLMTGMGQ